MDISKALTLVRGLEERMAELYAFYATVFDMDPDVVTFFKDMQVQEIGHRDMVDFQKRLLVASRVRCLDCPVDEAEFRAIDKRISNHMRQSPRPNLLQALRFAYEMETDAAEQHYKHVLNEANPEFAKLMNQLTKADRIHVQAIADLKKQVEANVRT